jgi:hypothetical protein
MNQIFSTITIIVFSVLMLIQIIETIRSYFDFEIVTRFDVQEMKILPNIVFAFNLWPNKNSLNKLSEIYPQLKQEIKKINQINISLYPELDKNVKLVEIYREYLVQLLIDNRLNDFHRIAQTNNFIKSCQINDYDNLELKNCTQGDFGIYQVGETVVIMRKRLDFSEMIDKNKVEKITFRLKSNEGAIHALLYLTLSRLMPSSGISIRPNVKTTATLSTFLVKKLRFNEIECISEENQDFSQEYFDFCEFDCIVDKVNQLFGCVPVYQVSFFFNKNFLKNNYKICKNHTLKHEFSSMSESSLKSFIMQCSKICKPKCNSVNFDTKIQVSKHVSNKTIFEVIPMKTPRIAYIETLKTDFDRLIYNCGGILGLWFGITPIKAVDLFGYIPKIYRILKELCATVFQFLITFWIRIKQNRMS